MGALFLIRVLVFRGSLEQLTEKIPKFFNEGALTLHLRLTCQIDELGALNVINNIRCTMKNLTNPS